MLKLLTVRATEVSPVLVVMVGSRACAFPLHHVAETMRPLPIKRVAGTPGFVCGVSVIRGTPTPVVDLKALLENCENSPSYEHCGVNQVKDKGAMSTWFLNNRVASN